MKKIKNITVVGRRWFNRGKGSTYHSAEIYVNGNPVHKIDYAYGYGDQYLHNAFAWLRQNHLKDMANNEMPWRYCEEHKIQLTYTTTDVGRKKDL